VALLSLLFLGAPERDVVDTIVVAASVELEVKIGSPASVEIKGKNIRSRTEQNKLTIFADGAGSEDVEGQVAVTVPRLVELVCEANAEVRIREIEEKSLKISASGQSVIEAAGKLETIDVSASGHSKLELLGLDVRSARVIAEGRSTVLLDVRESLSGSASGNAHVAYKRSPNAAGMVRSGSAVVDHWRVRTK
jgi:hypothetical protein